MLTTTSLRSATLLSAVLLSAAACTGPMKQAAPSRAAQPGAAEAHAAASDSSIARPGPGERPGLGTTFGESRHSQVRHAPFERDSRAPFAEVALYYNDIGGVEAAFAYHGAAVGAARTQAHGDVTVTITDAAGRPLPGGVAGGRMYVAGSDGERYNIEVRNDSNQRLEVVASVDGLDVIDGRPASWAKRGYIVGPYSVVVIDGFRTSDATVAAFRFGTVGESYAARTGSDRNVGVIGLAFFGERGSVWTPDEIHRRDTADPFPERYARPPQ